MWDLAPLPGAEPGSPALGVQSFSHWTTREVPVYQFSRYTFVSYHPWRVTSWFFVINITCDYEKKILHVIMNSWT